MSQDRVAKRLSGGNGRTNQGQHLANPLVAEVCNEEITRSIQGDAAGVIQGGQSWRSAVTRVSCCAGAGRRGDDACGRYFADSLVAVVGDEEISRRIHRY